MVRDPACKEEILGTAAVLQFAGGLLAYGLILGTIFWLRPEDTVAKLLVAILGSTLLFKASEVAVYWFESQVQSKYTVWVQNSVFLVFAAIKVALILSHASLAAFAWATMAEALTVALMMCVMLGLRGPKLPQLRITVARAKTLLKDCWPLMLSGMAIMINMRIDQVMLGELIGDDAVGVYAAAARVSEVWYFVPLAVIASVFPAIANARESDFSLYQARLQALYDGVAALALVVAVVTSFVAGPFMALLYGPAYAGSGVALAVLVWCGVFASLSFASGRWYLLEGLQKLALSRNLFGVVVNVAMNFVLIPRYGALGAAFSTLSAQCCAALLFDVFGQRTRDAFFMKLKALLMIGLLRRLFVR
jgi:O-antigen/teichoic acid export membrane protein